MQPHGHAQSMSTVCGRSSQKPLSLPVRLGLNGSCWFISTGYLGEANVFPSQLVM
jgi:hypothetical protein